MVANLGYLFYREYYKDYFTAKPYEQRAGENDADFKKRQLEYFESKNTKVFEASKQIVKSELEPLGNDTELRFSTTYPGMLIGSGYAFGSDSEGEFKLGFYFDHTTGMPVIPGSSVKGLLRSVFPKFTEAEVERNFNVNHDYYTNLDELNDEKKAKRKAQQQELKLKNEKALFTWWLAFQEEKQSLTETEYKKLYDLEEAIFESRVNGEPLPIYQRDIFHDAYIVESRHSDKKVLGSDFITPHKHKDRTKPELDPFSNPVPVMFLKVLPRVVFQFCLDLKEHGMSAADKKQLFHRILTTIGAGAKTNVGYGQLTSVNANPQSGQGARSAGMAQLTNFTGKIKQDEKLTAKVIRQERPARALIIVQGQEMEVDLVGGNAPAVNTIIEASINEVKAGRITRITLKRIYSAN